MQALGRYRSWAIKSGYDRAANARGGGEIAATWRIIFAPESS
jgi:hypothetical protein